jgi:putative tryptophan/tyrosine transport system substrate-binding protein
MIRRREFIAGLGDAAAWPLVVGAQQPERMRRIGVLMGWEESDSEAQGGLSAFLQGLSELGWISGRNVRMDVRWSGDRGDRIQIFAKELVGLQPDVILAGGTPVTAALQRETRTIPIVFAVVSDPVGDRFVVSLPRPGGNITGFVFSEAAMVGKSLQLLREIAPNIKRAAIMFNPDTDPGGGRYYHSAFEVAAQSLMVAAIAAPVHSDVEIEAAITSLGSEPGSGLIAPPGPLAAAHRATIISSTARNRVPAAYGSRGSVRDGGLLYYGPDSKDMLRRAAQYVDRLLRGTNPAELPVQVPVKFETALNLKTAKALGLTIPPNLLAVADEVIE